MSRMWANGSSRQWRKVRLLVLESNRIANGGMCQARCVGLCSGIATVAHHTEGRQLTGDDPRFIVAVCGPCNIHIGDPQTHPLDCKACVNVGFGPKARGLTPRTVTRW